MTPEQFCYWLQGYAEVAGNVPDLKNWVIIRDHLALVFKKETPLYDQFELAKKRNTPLAPPTAPFVPPYQVPNGGTAWPMPEPLRVTC